MEIFKKPSQLVQEIINNRALIFQLRKEYEYKIAGQIFYKRLSYYQQRINKANKLLSQYCVHGTSKGITHWEFKVEVEVRPELYAERILTIYMDSRLNQEEIEILLEHNIKCNILSSRIIGNPIKLGEVKFH